MANKLLIFIGAQKAFDVSAVDRAVVSLPGWNVKPLGPGIGALEQYLCIRDSHELTIRISSDAETVTIDGHPEGSSANWALAFQAALSSPLRITDMGYNFDLPLSEFGSAEQLLSAMAD